MFDNVQINFGFSAHFSIRLKMRKRQRDRWTDDQDVYCSCWHGHAAEQNNKQKIIQ